LPPRIEAWPIRPSRSIFHFFIQGFRVSATNPLILGVFLQVLVNSIGFDGFSHSELALLASIKCAFSLISRFFLIILSTPTLDERRTSANL